MLSNWISKPHKLKDFGFEAVRNSDSGIEFLAVKSTSTRSGIRRRLLLLESELSSAGFRPQIRRSANGSRATLDSRIHPSGFRCVEGSLRIPEGPSRPLDFRLFRIGIRSEQHWIPTQAKEIARPRGNENSAIWILDFGPAPDSNETHFGFRRSVVGFCSTALAARSPPDSKFWILDFGGPPDFRWPCSGFW